MLRNPAEQAYHDNITNDRKTFASEIFHYLVEQMELTEETLILVYKLRSVSL